MKRTLQLRREVLTELTDAELAGVAAGEDTTALACLITQTITVVTITGSFYYTCRCQLEPTITCA